MIPQSFQEKLLHDVISPTGKQTGYLCALVDMAAIPDETRQEIRTRFTGHLYPLLNEPGYEEAIPVGATLIAPADNLRQAQYDFLESLQTYNSDVISVWITSTLPVGELASHFAQATFAHDEQGKQYWLRYYDPFITPILYGQAPDDWQRWFFGPIHSWWFARPNAQNEQWHQIIGYKDKDTTAIHAPQLILTKPLWDALATDPLPYKILHALEAEGSARFESDCHGVRLARIKELLAEAQQSGFVDNDQQHDYVWLALHHDMPQIRRHDNWKYVRQEVLNGKGQLRHLTQQHITR